MAKVFARQTKLNNITGRSEYITDPKRQEEVIFHSKEHLHNPWQEYSEFEKQNQRSKEKNNEGREIIIALPHELETDLLKLEKLIDEYSFNLLGNNRDFEYAVHWNKKKTNLHAHIIYSEREIVKEREPKTYRRDMWYDIENNRMAKANSEGAELRYKKGDMMKDKEGNIRYDSNKFTKKDIKFKKRSFNEEIKEELKDTLNKYNFKYRLFNSKKEVAQIHVGHERSRNPETYNKLKNYNEEINILNEYLLGTETTPKFYKHIFKDLRIANKADWQFKVYEKSKEINDLNYNIKNKTKSIDKNKKAIKEFYRKVEKRKEITKELDKVTDQKYNKWNFLKKPTDLIIKKMLQKDLEKLNIEKEYREYEEDKNYLNTYPTPMHKKIAEQTSTVMEAKKKKESLLDEVEERKELKEDYKTFTDTIDFRKLEIKSKKKTKKSKEQEKKPAFNIEKLEIKKEQTETTKVEKEKTKNRKR